MTTRPMQCYEASVVPLAALGAAAMGQVRISDASAQRELMLVAKWLIASTSLCLSTAQARTVNCDAEFKGADTMSIEWAVAVTVPFSCDAGFARAVRHALIFKRSSSRDRVQGRRHDVD
jgi:hypothetical protein